MKSIVISGGCASMVRRAPVVSKAIVEALSNPAALSGTELRIQLRRDEATNWGAENPVLFEGELGVDTTSKNLKLGDGTSAWNDLPFLSVKPSDVSSAIAAALGAYTPTSGLAAIATSGNAADLFGTLPNSRLSAQVVRNDFNYTDPAWINSLAASKITGSFGNITATGNGSITGTLQIGGAAGHLLRWNAGAAALEVRDSGNSWYRKTRLGELQIIADTGGNFVTPANARLGFLTQIGGYIAGAISGRTYSGSAIYGDIVISASPAIGTGQNDYSGLTDDLAIRGNTGNVEINRGLLSIGMAGQAARSLSILAVNTGDRTGVRVYDYGSFASAATQAGFEVVYLGGTLSAPSSPVSGHYRNLLTFKTGGTNSLLASTPSFAIRSTIGSVIGSSLSVVDTSLMVTPTITGVTIPVITMYGNTGLVDFPVGQIQLGTNVRLKNNAGELQVRNSGDSDFAPVRADYFRFKNGSYFISDATYNYSVDNLDAVKAFRAKTFTASAGDMLISVFGDRVVSSTSAQPWTFLTSANASLGIKIGSLVVSDSYSDNAPANGLFVKGNSIFAGHLTSAFQSLSADPTASDIASGLARLVKNTTTGEIAEWANDGGSMRKLSSTQGALSFRVDGGGSVPSTGAKKLMFRVPYKCTITGWYLAADVSGSVVVDIWKNATYPPVNADSITAAAKPTLSSSLQASSTTLTGWTTLLNAGDYIEIEVESATTLTAFALTLTVTRS